ncbi:MAG TPA: Ig-like domain-containing protein, partial [Saprospiraceae bacterium]
LDGALGVTVSLLGPSAANRVLIGQFTTGGVFSGQLNLQIREVATGIVEQYVAETPGAGQFTHSSLTWGPNSAPAVTITAPADGANFAASTLVNISATAIDTDGAIDSVNFYKDGVLLATVQGPGPYNTSFTTGLFTTSHAIVARGWDDAGGVDSDTINITVTGNNPPVVVLTSPPTAVQGTTVNVSATATDSDGILDVKFYFDGGLVATDLLGAPGADPNNITITVNQAPTATITSPVDEAFVSEGPVNISANATDTDGTVTEVEFFANGVSIGVDNSGPGPWTISWNAVYATYAPSGDVQLTAKAKDNLNLVGVSSPIVDVTIINPAGSPYILDDVNQVCNDATVCMPLTVVSAISNVIGFDMILEWDNSLIVPTGNIIKSSDLLNADLFETDYSIDLVNEKMLVSVFLDVDAPFGTFFAGTGDIICVEFVKRPAFQSVDTTTIDVPFFQESYFSEVVDQIVPAGVFTTFRNTIMSSNVEFWLDNKPVGFDGSNPIVNIQANTSIDCSLPSAATPAVLSGTIINPDVNGLFTYDLAGGVKFSIDKDLAGTTDVQEVVNGFDALLTRRVLIDDANFTPNVYQVISMDVNRDGVISAGDVSQINQRAVLILNEYRQAWNYNADGSQKPGYAPSKDWQFIDLSTVLFNPTYQISSNFPQDNGVGFSKHRVPQIPFCLTGPVTSFATCPVIGEESYIGIMYGDVNGNWRNTTDVLLRSPSSVDINMDNARYSEEYIDVPVSFTAVNDINAIDFSVGIDGNKLAFHSVIANGIQAVGHFNENDGKLRITSNSLNTLVEGEVAFLIRFTRLSENTLDAADFQEATGYLNGDKVNVNLVAPGATPSSEEVTFTVYPNPASNELFINLSKDATAEIMDMNGRVVLSNITVSANAKERLDVSNLPGGLYTIRVFSTEFTSTQRVFIGK